MGVSATTNRDFNLLTYYLVSVSALVFFGVVYKALFVVYNYSQFSTLAFSDVAYALFWGLRFDLASAALFSLISCIVIWLCYRLTKLNIAINNPARLLLVISLLSQTSLQISDVLYYAESGRHVSYEVRDVLIDATGLFFTAVSSHLLFIVLSYLLALILILSVVRLSKSYISNHFITQPSDESLLLRVKQGYGIRLFAVLFISVLLVRGGVTGLPQSVISAFKIGDAKQAVIAMNGAYSIVYGVLNSSKEITRVAVNLPKDINVNEVMNSLYPKLPEFNAKQGVEINQYNIVFVLMEGWPADLMSAYGYPEDTTPFFKSLKEKAYSPLGAFSGGVRTTEGIYAIFCSQQNPLGKTVAQTSLQNNDYECLPEILKQQGWHTAFFQGSHKETSGTGAFAQSLGFTESHAKEDMPEGRYAHNYWGAHDPDIYDYVLDKLDAMPQPFLVGINTNSTHDVQVPQGETFRFGDSNRHQKHMGILHFADQSMREFFEKIKTKPYYDNTIFVLLSDHTGGKHNSVAEKYYIPAIIYADKIIDAKKINHFVSHRDFAPTVLDIVGLPAARSFTGQSFWHNDPSIEPTSYFADYFDSGSIGWISGNMLVETSISKPSEIKCYFIDDGFMAMDEVTCTNEHKSNSIKSLSFTSYSQDLLFDGRTKLFYQFADQ